MRETIKDWKRDWIEANGETNELEVAIYDSRLDRPASEVYEGSFADIPKDLIDKKVIEWARIVISSEPEREGAFALTI